MIYSKVYYISPQEDLDKVEQKIQNTLQQKIILVLPEENKNLKNSRALSYLKKVALKNEKILSIFSTDPFYQKLAQEVGILLEDKILESGFVGGKEVSFRPKVRDIYLPREAPKRLPSEVLFQKIPAKFPVGLLFFLIFVAVALATWNLGNYFSRAHVVIVPQSQVIDFQGELLAREGVLENFETMTIPAKLIAKQKKVSRSFLTTGKEIKETKAEGKIVIYNESGRPLFWKPSRFESQDGKIFWSKTFLNIPAGTPQNPGKLEVQVIADKPGEEYNIGPSEFRVPALKEQGNLTLYKQVYARSFEPMKGGARGEMKVVLKEDIEKAKSQLKTLSTEVISQLKNEILEEIPDELKELLKDKIEVGNPEISFDKNAGEVGESFTATMIIEGKVLTFEEADLEKVIFNLISPQIGKEVEEVKGEREIKYELLSYDLDAKEMRLKFKGSQKIALKVDEKKIVEEIKGMDTSTLQQYFQNKNEIKEAKVDIFPFWVNKLPTNPARIAIKVQYK